MAQITALQCLTAATVLPVHLSSNAAEAGLYLDLKGARGDAPILLGIADRDGFEVVVLDNRFGDAAMARDLRVGHMEAEIASLLERAAAAAAPIVGLHRTVLETVDADTDLGDELARVFVAAADLADTWQSVSPGRGRAASRTRAGSPRDLDALLAAIDRPRTPRWSPRHTTPRLRYVEQQLRRHGAFAAITGTAKAKWTRLLRHCEADARGLRDLTCELALRLSATEAAPAAPTPRGPR